MAAGARGPCASTQARSDAPSEKNDQRAGPSAMVAAMAAITASVIATIAILSVAAPGSALSGIALSAGAVQSLGLNMDSLPFSSSQKSRERKSTIRQRFDKMGP